ncbi:unnamed protein product [Heligmosomoides polygyrus]|uniref:Coatomer subunit zeta n=1 Tax=Heligmosomoides polygyrus TaxID=6339 RepID=A0A183GC46_HELPZ|nr:unnamed protein product [Heligmosomoides polygyrus]
MGFDGMVLKSVLESFVDEIAEESTELILERPRYAYAVVVIADDNEMCEFKDNGNVTSLLEDNSNKQLIDDITRSAKLNKRNTVQVREKQQIQ